MPNTGFINVCFIIDIDTLVKFNDTSQEDEPTLTISEDLEAFFKENQGNIDFKILTSEKRLSCENNKIYLYKINDGFGEKFQVKFPFKVSEENFIFYKENSERVPKINQESENSGLQLDQIVIVSPDATLLQGCSQYSVIFPFKGGELASNDFEKLIERLAAVDEDTEKRFKLDIDDTLLLNEQSKIAGKTVINSQMVKFFNSNSQTLKNSFYMPLTTRPDSFEAAKNLIPKLKSHLSEEKFQKLINVEIVYTLECLEELRTLLTKVQELLFSTVKEGAKIPKIFEELYWFNQNLNHSWGALPKIIKAFQDQTGLLLELSPECFLGNLPDKSVPIQSDLQKHPLALHIFFDNTYKHLQAARKLPEESLCVVQSLEKNEFASKARELYTQLQKKYPLPQNQEEEYLYDTNMDISKSDSELKENSEYSYDEHVNTSANDSESEKDFELEHQDFEIKNKYSMYSEEINAFNLQLNEHREFIILLCDKLLEYINHKLVIKRLFKNKKDTREIFLDNLADLKNHFENQLFTIDKTACLICINNCLLQLNKIPRNKKNQDILSIITTGLSKLNDMLSSYTNLLDNYAQVQSKFLKCLRKSSDSTETISNLKRPKFANSLRALRNSMSEMLADVADAKREDLSEDESLPENELSEGEHAKMQGDLR